MHAAALITLLNAAVSPSGQGAAMSASAPGAAAGVGAKPSPSGQAASVGVADTFQHVLAATLAADASASLASGPAAAVVGAQASAATPGGGAGAGDQFMPSGPASSAAAPILQAVASQRAPQPAPPLVQGLLAAESTVALAIAPADQAGLPAAADPASPASAAAAVISLEPQGRDADATGETATAANGAPARPVVEIHQDPAASVGRKTASAAKQSDPAEMRDLSRAEDGSPPPPELPFTVPVCNVAPAPAGLDEGDHSRIDAELLGSGLGTEPSTRSTVIVAAPPILTDPLPVATAPTPAPGAASETPMRPFDQGPGTQQQPAASAPGPAQAATLGSSHPSPMLFRAPAASTSPAAAPLVVAQAALQAGSDTIVPAADTLGAAWTPAAVVADMEGAPSSEPDHAARRRSVVAAPLSAAVTPPTNAPAALELAADAPAAAEFAAATATSPAAGPAATLASVDGPDPAAAAAPVVTAPALPQLASAAPVAAQLAASAVTSITGERTDAPAKAEPAAPAAATATAAANSAQPAGKPTSSSSGQDGQEAPSERPSSELRADVVAHAELDQPSAERAAAEPLRAEAALQPAAPAEARTPQAVRGAPETVANLAAEIARRMDGRTTRFEMSLDPLDLGAVQVSLEIAADGSLAARVACERPEALAELRGRSAELQRALEQAGFDLSKGGLSFEQGQGRERHSPDGQPRHEGARARAFQDALLAAEAADTLPAQPLRLRDRPRAGLDLRI